MFIDTHLHLVDQAALNYPWLASAGDLNRNFLYAEYAQQARRLGIGGALHMEVDVDPLQIETETAFVQGLAEQQGSLIRGAIAACRPESADFPAYLERQDVNPFVKGFRRVLHVVPDDLSESALFRENMKRLNDSRFSFDLCVLPHQITKAVALVDLAPDTQFILDHCGVPSIKDGLFEPWRENVAEIAKRPNVTAKISGVVAYADAESWTVDTIRPYVEHVVGSFGFGRLVWGSDWPVCTLGGGLATWVGATHALFAGSSITEREKLYSGNAKRIWTL
ncbi:MAG: amidohydrolase family protein [Phyllobacterium sp.]